MHLLESAHVCCPYCGESLEVLIDCSVAQQEYIEDCQVCCQPITLTVDCADGGISLQARREDEC
jgi:hypothetical protein